MYTPMQESRNIAGTLRYGDDLYRLALSAIGDEIRADRPEPDRIRSEVFAYMAHSRHAVCRERDLKTAWQPSHVDVKQVEALPRRRNLFRKSRSRRAERSGWSVMRM